MNFTRSAACTLAAISEQQFKTLDRRAQLAIRDRSTVAEEDAGRRFPRLTFPDVVALAAQAELINDYGPFSGLSPDTARIIVANTRDFQSEVLATGAPVDAWVGYVSKPKGAAHAGGHVTGTLIDVASQIGKDGPDASRVYLLNLSKVIRDVRERAARAGIEIA